MADPVGEKQNKASVYGPAKSGQVFCRSCIHTVCTVRYDLFCSAEGLAH